MYDKLFENYLRVLWESIIKNVDFTKASQVRYSQELGKLSILLDMYRLLQDRSLYVDKHIIFLNLVELYDDRFSKSKCKK